jgi:excisionase family DNA binding protein
MNKSVQTEELLTLAEVAAYLKLSRRTAWRWCKSGHLPAIKVGHQWRVTRSDLENFIHHRGRLIL